MTKLTERYEIKLTTEEYEMLVKLRKYKVCPSKFIRMAIKEKLDKDFNTIVKKSEKISLRKVKEIYF